MLEFFLHCYEAAEVYAVFLVWIVVPLGTFALYLFCRNHFGVETNGQD